jgi:hypothetical protein
MTIPCYDSIQDMRIHQKINAMPAESGGGPIIDVEGYIVGVLIGGIKLQFGSEFVY